MSASTHTFKNCGCYGTHSAHTNEGPCQGNEDLMNNMGILDIELVNFNFSFLITKPEIQISEWM